MASSMAVKRRPGSSGGGGLSAAVAASTFAAVGAGALIDTSEGTGTTTFTDLTTPGPAVTITVPASGKVTVSLTATMSQSNALGYGLMGFAITGANTVAAADAKAVAKFNTIFETKSGEYTLSGLTPGSSTFTAKYRADTAGTATFARRNIFVQPC